MSGTSSGATRAWETRRANAKKQARAAVAATRKRRAAALKAWETRRAKAAKATPAESKTGTKKYLCFTRARRFARSLNLQTAAEWYFFAKSNRLPADVPPVPSRVYKTQWRGWRDWL